MAASGIRTQPAATGTRERRARGGAGRAGRRAGQAPAATCVAMIPTPHARKISI